MTDNTQPSRMNHGPITDAERVWVARALHHRKWMVGLRLIQFCVVGSLICLLFPILLWVSQAIEDTPLNLPWWLIWGANGFALFSLVILWRIHRHWVSKLPSLLGARVPADLSAQTMHGRLVVYQNDESCAAIEVAERGDLQHIQVPSHWLQKRAVSNGPQQLRVAKVDASGKSVVAKSIVRGGITSSGTALSTPVTYATYADPDLVLLAMGNLSVDTEVLGGLGYPGFRSWAGMSLALGASIMATLVAFFVWVTSDYSVKVADVASVIYALCAVVQLSWLVPLVFLLRRTRRTNRFYGRTENGNAPR